MVKKERKSDSDAGRRTGGKKKSAGTRRPVPEKVQEMGYRIGGAIIFSLMAVALFNDFTRL